MISDTHPEIAARQREMFRRMTREERLRIAMEMSDDMRRVALDGLRHRHPDLSEKELDRELIRLMYGITLPE